MHLVSQALWLLSFGLLSGIAAFLLHAALGLAPEIAGLVGVILFLVLWMARAQLLRRRERREIDHRLMALYEDYQSALSQYEDLRAQFHDLRSELAGADRRRNGELISEIRILQTLLTQVAGGTAATRGRKDLRSLAGAGDEGAPHAAAERPDEREILSIIQNALQDNRVDLYLQPIVRLPSRRPAFYEAYSRVRDASGTIVFPREYLPLAEASGLVGTLDNLLLFRCIQVIRRLGPRRPDVRFFCNISAASLADQDFFPQFIDFMVNNLELADRLVFEFSQASVRDQSPEVERSLALLGRRGFRFSMDHVTDLHFDPASLAARHFQVVKVSADLFLAGGGHIASEDLQEVLARHGIALVIEKIESEPQVIDILDYGVEYGQGFLFGEPRPSRDEAALGEGHD